MSTRPKVIKFQLGVKGGGKEGQVGGSIVGLWRWKTVPSAVFWKVA